MGTSGPRANPVSNLKKRSKKKKGFFGKIVGVFKGDGGKNDKNPSAPSKSGDSGAPPQIVVQLCWLDSNPGLIAI